MSTNNTFLAVFLGSKTSPRMTAWNALPESERHAKQQEGIAGLLDQARRKIRSGTASAHAGCMKSEIIMPEMLAEFET